MNYFAKRKLGILDKPSDVFRSYEKTLIENAYHHLSPSTWILFLRNHCFLLLVLLLVTDLINWWIAFWRYTWWDYYLSKFHKAYERYHCFCTGIARRERTCLLEQMEQLQKKLNGIPASVLTEKAEAFSKAKASQELKSIIPPATQLYEQAKTLKSLFASKKQACDITKVKQGQTIAVNDIDVGPMRAGENVVIDLPLVPTVALAESDYSGTSSSRNPNGVNALHVGAIEVILESYASPDSDLMGGILLVDTFHQKPQNAVRSIFLAPFRGGRPVRVICFPDTLVQMGPSMNDRFKLLCTTSNSDFTQDANLATVRANIVACAVGPTKQYTPTAFLDQSLNRERGMIVEYLNRHCVAMHNTNLPSSSDIANQKLKFSMDRGISVNRVRGGLELSPNQPLLFSVAGGDVGKTIRDAHSTQRGDTCDEQAVDGKDGLIHRVFGQGEPSIQATTDLFQDSLQVYAVKPTTALDDKIATYRVPLSKSAITNAELRSIELYDILVSGRERMVVSLAHMHKIPYKLRCVAEVNVPENTGCAIMMSYNSTSTSTEPLNLFTSSSQDSVVWNPACERNMTLHFNPNPCGDAWSFSFLEKTGAHFSLMIASGWTATPLADLQITLNFYLSKERCAPQIVNLSEPPTTMWMNQWLGRVLLKQGTSPSVSRIPLTLGSGAGVEKNLYTTMSCSALSYWRYFTGDLCIQVTKMSSPYIKATLKFFIAFGDADDDSTLIDAYPHKLVQFSEIRENYDICFTQEEFLTAWSTQVKSSTKLANDGCPMLYVMVHDSVVSTIPGDFCLGVRLRCIENFKPYGHNPGVVGSRMALQASCVEPLGIANQLTLIAMDPNIDPAKQASYRFRVDLLTGIATSEDTSTPNVIVYRSPLSNLLRTSAWKRGRLRYTVNATGAGGVKRSDWTSHTIMSLHNSVAKEHISARNWQYTEPHGWTCVFDLDIVGPNEGFEMANAEWASQTTWYLNFIVSNPAQTIRFNIDVQNHQDFCVSGNNIVDGLSFN